MSENNTNNDRQNSVEENIVKGINPKKKSWIGLIAGVSVFVLGLAIVAIIICKDLYHSSETKIENVGGFVDMVTKNSNTSNDNATYRLKNNITLTADDLNKIYSVKNQTLNTGAWFHGKFYGGGYTVKITADVTAPIFDKICENAVFRDVNFECKTINSSESVEELSLLAKENYGIIENISVYGDENSNFTEVDLSNKIPKAASVICVRNYGKIYHSAIKAEIKVPNRFCQGTNMLPYDRVWNCYFGAVSAYCLKSGSISGAIVSVEFEDNFTPLELHNYNLRGDKNDRIGYFIGYKENYDLDSGYIYCVIGGKYVSSVTDYYQMPKKKTNTYASINDIRLEDQDKWSNFEIVNDFLRVKQK